MKDTPGQRLVKAAQELRAEAPASTRTPTQQAYDYIQQAAAVGRISISGTTLWHELCREGVKTCGTRKVGDRLLEAHRVTSWSELAYGRLNPLLPAREQVLSDLRAPAVKKVLDR